jgi:toxin ParE1/3/4
MAHRLAPQARAELSSIWNYIFKESGNAVAADSVIDAITERFYLLSQYPHMGRARDDLRPGLHSFPVGQDVIICTIEDGDVEILHVFHGRQDIEGQLGQQGTYETSRHKDSHLTRRVP